MRTKIFLIASILISLQLLSGVIEESEAPYFEKRRDRLMGKLGDGFAVLCAPPISFRNLDIEYPYRQSSNIYYLTGLEMNNITIVFVPGDKKPFKLFAYVSEDFATKDQDYRLGVEGLKKLYGVDEILPPQSFNGYFYRLLKSKRKLYLDFGDKKILKLLAERFVKPDFPEKMVNLHTIIGEMRIIKDDLEISWLQKAVDITGEALKEAMKRSKPGIYEYQIGAVLDYVFKNSGSFRKGFPSIIASGHNGEELHYQANNRLMEDGDMLLMDVGAEYGFYSADISRSFPVNGKFSRAQKKIYSIVLKAHKKGLNAMKPGIGIKDVVKVVSDSLTKDLFKIGLITDQSKDWQTLLWAKFFGFCHWLGLDTHDNGGRKSDKPEGRILETGMVTTLEPGLYIPAGGIEGVIKRSYYGKNVSEEEKTAFIKAVTPVYEKYKNIFVRIEDDVLITNEGRKVLSADIPVEIDDIEALMKKKSSFK